MQSYKLVNVHIGLKNTGKDKNTGKCQRGPQSVSWQLAFRSYWLTVAVSTLCPAHKYLAEPERQY